ncbi:MAG: hypothetical protein AB1644_07190 [Candidatus Zixiibacteriota bacterium]
MASKAASKETVPVGLDVLDGLIEKCYMEIAKTLKEKPKLGDLLKMIEMRKKLAPQNSAQREFWNMMDRIRREALANDGAAVDISTAHVESVKSPRPRVRPRSPK